MAKKQQPVPAQKTAGHENIISTTFEAPVFGLPWWVGAIILAVVSVVLYIPSLDGGYTDLDDTIFVRDFEQYNRSDSNYLYSFKRGVFAINDNYYRPLLLNSFVWDRHREGKLTATLHPIDLGQGTTDDISQYRETNLLLHILCVVLVLMFLRFHLRHETIAFAGALLFALHPAFVQAVAWIPGRNDTLLTFFALLYALSSWCYARNGRAWLPVIQFVALLGALFTKETAVLLVPAVLVTMLMLQYIRLADKRLWVMTAIGAIAGAAWFVARNAVTSQAEPLMQSEVTDSILDRFPLLWQSLGKLLLPINLNVFPWVGDTSNIPGLIAALLCAGIAAWLWRADRRRELMWFATGILWYVLFLLPAVIVPSSLNREAFEHRLYLPFAGVLLALCAAGLAVARTWSLAPRNILLAGVVLATVAGTYSFMRLDLFTDKFRFWESAVASTPSAAYPRMMLAARYYRDKLNPRKSEAEKLFAEAYARDSAQKYLNYYMGNLAIERGDADAAARYYKKEIAKDVPILTEICSKMGRYYVENKQ
ncbi:MAG: glycosyltransferase family 39 protein, partial [Candidatus Kapabacteria bacterium]|nr:glycosyltransferase family 39 protein [Candidatus Kapabacteria bacterium]